MLNRKQNIKVMDDSINRLLMLSMIPTDGTSTVCGVTTYQFHHNNDYYVIAFGQLVDQFQFVKIEMSVSGAKEIINQDGLSYHSIREYINTNIKNKYYGRYKN